MVLVLWTICLVGQGYFNCPTYSPSFKDQQTCQKELVRLVDGKELVAVPGYSFVCWPA